MKTYINPTHAAADAFWDYWKENGETHKHRTEYDPREHGYIESTWGAINAAIAAAGVVTDEDIAETNFPPKQ